MSNNLYDHQKQAVEAAFGQSSFGYFMEQGTGKTLTVLEEARQWNVDKIVVISPKSAILTWCDEVEKWRPDLKSSYIKYTKKQKKLIDAADVFCINFDSAHSKKGKELIWNFIKGKKFGLIIDEAHFIKSPSAKRSITCMNLAKLNDKKTGTICKTVRLLTGTPTTNGSPDAYNLLKIFGNKWGRVTFNDFKKHFCNMVLKKQFYKDRSGNVRNRMIYQIDGFKNLDELAAELKKHSFRVLKEDCLDLPDKIYSRKILEMPSSIRKQYNELKKDLLTIIDDSEISVNNALTKFLRLQQLCSGYINDDEGNLIVMKENVKLNALEEELEDGLKAIVFCKFTYEIQIIKEMLKKLNIEYREISGSIKTEDRQKAVKDFQEDENVQVFIGQVEAASTNITLTEAKKEIYYSNSLNLATRLQSEDRAHRIGLKDNLSIIDFVTKDSVEERILEMLLTKKDVASIIASDKKEIKDLLN